MHDTLLVSQRDPLTENSPSWELPVRMVMAFRENFVLAFHDEVLQERVSFR